MVDHECSILRTSYGDEIVVGFGSPRLADFPLRSTLRSPWLLHSRYGSWRVVDGADVVASDAEPLTDTVLQHARAVLLHQRVANIHFDHGTRHLRIGFVNGAAIEFMAADDTATNEPMWSLEAPGGLLIEATADEVTATKSDVEKPSSERAALHQLLRDVAGAMNLVLFEPPYAPDSAVDAILTASDGSVVLLELKRQSSRTILRIRTVGASSDAGVLASHDLPLGAATTAVVIEQIRQMLSAA